jgi:hypothetical protein
MRTTAALWLWLSHWRLTSVSEPTTVVARQAVAQNYGQGKLPQYTFIITSAITATTTTTPTTNNNNFTSSGFH